MLVLICSMTLFIGASARALPSVRSSIPARAAVAVGSLLVGKNTNAVGAYDTVERKSSCNVGKQAPQNETTIAVDPEDPNVLVGGANDYRLYSAKNRRYDGSGGYFRSTDGGRTWRSGYLPGIVDMNPTAPGPYETAGDPAIAAGPAHTFWYANIAFTRDQSRSAVSVSRSTDGGRTWKTSFVIKSKGGVFNDKEWIAADPKDPRIAYVTWTAFAQGAEIVISKTTDGGKTWSEPRTVASGSNQGSVPAVDDLGFVHVVYAAGIATIAHAVSADGGKTFVTRELAPVVPWNDSGLKFRTPNFLPSFAADGADLHVVYGSWSGTSNDILYIHSPDHGLTWIGPVALGSSAGDQFFPWVGASNGKVFASWFHRAKRNHVLVYAGAGSSDHGLTWTAQRTISSKSFDVLKANRVAPSAGCTYFMGDYSSIAVGSDGVAHPLWTDGRIGNSPGDPGSDADLDPYSARITL